RAHRTRRNERPCPRTERAAATSVRAASTRARRSRPCTRPPGPTRRGAVAPRSSRARLREHAKPEATRGRRGRHRRQRLARHDTDEAVLVRAIDPHTHEVARGIDALRYFEMDDLVASTAAGEATFRAARPFDEDVLRRTDERVEMRRLLGGDDFEKARQTIV